MNLIPQTIGAKPGTQRDGTYYLSDYAVDSKNVRWDEDFARKVLGWQDLIRGNPEIVRTMFGVPNSQSNDVYLGRSSSLNFFNLPSDENAPVGPEITRVPSTAFPFNNNNLWSLSSFTANASTDPNPQIVAQVAPNASDISSEVLGPVFIGSQDSNAPLTQIIDSSTAEAVLLSGGVICFQKLIIGLTNNGIIRWAQQDSPMDWASYQAIGNTKCVAAVVYQGSLIVWTLNRLYRLTYPAAADSDTFDVQEYPGNISILSAQSIAVYLNNIYWVGDGVFFQFNGTIGRIPNKMCKNYFFDNLTYNQKGKISSFIDYQNDEWWVMGPRDGSTENNDAVMYYPASNTWTSTEIHRSTAVVLTNYRYRLMASNTLFKTLLPNGQILQSYPVWEHEKGLDEVWNNVHAPIEAYVEYPIMDFFTAQPSAANNICIQSERIEPDFILPNDPTINMEVSVISRMYAQSPDVVAGPFLFNAETEYLDIPPLQGRLIRVRFSSNVIGGYFEMGRTLQGIKKGAAAA